VISFKSWLQKEEMTSTSCIAHFQNRLSGMHRRDWWFSNQEKLNKKGKNKFTYRVPQIQS
jgi:hypothetical protein